jgi:hypothetical protein
VLKWLAWREVGYAIKVPFFPWLDPQQFIRSSPTVEVARDGQVLVVPIVGVKKIQLEVLHRSMRDLAPIDRYRKPVHAREPPAFHGWPRGA